MLSAKYKSQNSLLSKVMPLLTGVVCHAEHLIFLKNVFLKVFNDPNLSSCSLGSSLGFFSCH